MKKILLAALCLLFVTALYSQDMALADSLKQNLENATTPEAKIKWLGQLSSLYLNLNKELSEQYGRQQMEVAELSRDRKLMLDAILSHADRYYNSNGVQEYLNKAKVYSEQALKLAQDNNMQEYIAWSHMSIARGARNEGEKEKALNHNNLAVSISSTTENDSLKISALNALGSTYLSRDEKLLAFRNYLQALNTAEATGSYPQLRSCYYYMSAFYEDLEEYEKSKDYLFKVLNLSVRYNERWDRLDLYTRIGNVYVKTKQYDLATTFYENSMKLADSLNFGIYKLNLYGRLVDMYLISNQAEKAMSYFKEKRELRDFMTNAGFSFYVDHAYALGYTFMKKFDSARYHFELARPGFEGKASMMNKYYFYVNYADYFSRTGNYQKSLDYFLQAKRIADERRDISMLQAITQQLDSVYQRLGDFKNAHHYNTRYHHYKDSLESLATEKDLLALEVDNENKRKEREATQAEAAKRERHNIQYMGITTAIAGVFMILIMLGFFKVSKTTIRILGFFAFIFLFEFIILLADHRIHDWTHGEPWKILAIKIGLISILLPLHHYLEQRVISYLTSRKLLEVNPREFLSKISGRTEESVIGNR